MTYDDEEEVDRRVEIRDLGVGWQFHGPLGDWETIDRVEEVDGEYGRRIWTDRTGPDYSWRLPLWKKVYAVPPNAERLPKQPEIRIMQFGMPPSAHIMAVLTFAHIEMPDLTFKVVEAAGRRGQGWEVIDQPAGGPTVTSHHDSKATALTALRRAARVHAEALGVRLCETEGWHRHEPPADSKESKE